MVSPRISHWVSLRTSLHFALGFALLACVAVMTSFPAHAGGGNVSVGVSYYSGPGYHHRGYYRPAYWGPRHYYGPRYRSSIVVFPAPVYAAPRPVYYPAPYPAYPVPAPAPVVQATQQCTQYNGDAIVDGSGQPFYGRACLFTDGRWHIVP